MLMLFGYVMICVNVQVMLLKLSVEGFQLAVLYF